MEGPIEYSITEIGNIEIDTEKTSLVKDWGDNPPDSVTTLYQPKKRKKKRKCSFCKKRKEIYYIEGVQIFKIKVKDIERMQRKNIYHRTFHIVCESCACAKVV